MWAWALMLLAAMPPAAAPGDSRPAAPASRERFGFEGPMTQGGVVIGSVPSRTSALTLDGITLPVAPDGRFVIAFDRDAPPAARLVATREDGTTVAQTLSVAPRAWQIERLATLAKTPLPDAEFARQRPAELARIEAARATLTDAAGWRQHFLWPVLGRISGRFGAQRIYRGEPGAYHAGVDVAKPDGAVVLAPADGVVILAADHPFTLEGNLLMIDHGMGLNSAFLHLSRIDVPVGAHVRQGQAIGRVGHSGRATGAHLHWGMKWRDRRIDPLLLAGPMPVAE